LETYRSWVSSLCSQFGKVNSLGQEIKGYGEGKNSSFIRSIGKGGVITPGYYRMNRKALVLGVIFLAIALIFPILVIYEDNAATTQSLLNYRPDLNDWTARVDFFTQMQARQNALLIALVAVEVVLVILFAITMWIALRPPHEKHLEHEHLEHDMPSSG